VVHGAGTIGTWWFLPSGCCLRLLRDSYLQLITTSFGSTLGVWCSFDSRQSRSCSIHLEIKTTVYSCAALNFYWVRWVLNTLINGHSRLCWIVRLQFHGGRYECHGSLPKSKAGRSVDILVDKVLLMVSLGQVTGWSAWQREAWWAWGTTLGLPLCPFTHNWVCHVQWLNLVSSAVNAQQLSTAPKRPSGSRPITLCYPETRAAWRQAYPVTKQDCQLEQRRVYLFQALLCGTFLARYTITSASTYG
jgi:hypothetical protein